LHERITIRMTSKIIARIDAWMADQPGYVSRQDAVRHCVDLVLPQNGQEERRVSALGETRAEQANEQQRDYAWLTLLPETPNLFLPGGWRTTYLSDCSPWASG